MSRSYKKESRRAAREWRGPEVRFDLLKEATIATILVVVVIVVLALLFSGPGPAASPSSRGPRTTPTISRRRP